MAVPPGTPSRAQAVLWAGPRGFPGESVAERGKRKVQVPVTAWWSGPRLCPSRTQPCAPETQAPHAGAHSDPQSAPCKRAQIPVNTHHSLAQPRPCSHSRPGSRAWLVIEGPGGGLPGEGVFEHPHGHRLADPCGGRTRDPGIHIPTSQLRRRRWERERPASGAGPGSLGPGSAWNQDPCRPNDHQGALLAHGAPRRWPTGPEAGCSRLGAPRGDARGGWTPRRSGEGTAALLVHLAIAA
uniref:Uncharacterized protein n=1 Tax=Pipistrellus kuhlii TaxID=59472 RepID=A0A7J7SEK1_PIPKU|nr:hypothetical protein mPipKuh1_010007 [Pipistrellus kuhlii]